MKTIISNTAQTLSPLLWGEIGNISSLKNYHKMVIQYQSIGCFHNKCYIFKFKGNLVSIYRNTSVYQEEEKLGELLLSKRDIKGLDILLYFFSKNRTMGCTTTESITIKVMIGSLVIQKYNFSDSSCNMHEPKGILSFNSLLERLPKINS